MASSNWIIIYDTATGQVTRRIWDDENELSLNHPAAQLLKTEAAFLYPARSFAASVQTAKAGGYTVEVEPALMNAVSVAAASAGHTSAASGATATGQAVIDAPALAAAAVIAKQKLPPGPDHMNPVISAGAL